MTWSQKHCPFVCLQYGYFELRDKTHLLTYWQGSGKILTSWDGEEIALFPVLFYVNKCSGIGRGAGGEQVKETG
jgi:hypothetical protein